MSLTTGFHPAAHTGGIVLVSAALGMGRESELLPWHLDSSVLPGNARSTPVSEVKGVSLLGQEQVEQLPLLSLGQFTPLTNCWAKPSHPSPVQ